MQPAEVPSSRRGGWAFASITVPAPLWLVLAVGLVVVLAVLATGMAVAGRQARIESKVDALYTAVTEVDTRLKSLDGKVEALRAAPAAAAPAAAAAAAQKSTTTAPSGQPPATGAAGPGQIVPRKKP